MLSRLFIFNAFSVLLVTSMYVVNPGPQYPPTKGEVWPQPQQQRKYVTFYKLRPTGFKFTETGKTCDILKTAIERYSQLLRSMYYMAWRHTRKMYTSMTNRPNITNTQFQGNVEELKINLSSPCERYPRLNMDESYSLNVSTVSTLNSNSIWGILRGMETFSQLFYMSDDYTDIFINKTKIVDFPRYPHRGLLIDTSRHYVTVRNILKTLDAMEMNKMNVLHWHIVDDQSFPYQSEKFPQLSELGAYDQSMIYTKNNIQQIVNYARDRGIRVLPEFDVPGHTRSWGVAFPNILTRCYQSGNEIGLGPMDPTNNITYKLIGELFQEVQHWFPDAHFHVGGDEVEMNCWKSNSKVVDFMTAHNMTNPRELHAYFMKLVIPLLQGKSKPIVWQEVFDEGVPLADDVIVQVWKSTDPEEMIRILSAGLQVIYSASWYLDHLSSGGDWLDFYKADPRQMIPKLFTELNKDGIIGGEACMWGEVVDDRNVISRVWPRTSAVAEKLWSAESPRYGYFFRLAPSDRNVYHRLEEHTCRMNRRGIEAQPPNGPGFCVTS